MALLKFSKSIPLRCVSSRHLLSHISELFEYFCAQPSLLAQTHSHLSD